MKIVRLAFALIVASLSVPAAAQAGGELRLIDYTDDFARVWNATAALPDEQRAAAFKAEFAKVLPGFYDHKRMRGATEAQYDEWLIKKLKAYPGQRDGIARVSRDFAGSIAPARASFERAFGPLTGYPDVYLVNSLGEFDGGTRSLSDGVHLMFGADMIDRIYKTMPIRPFFHHELFHLYHERTFKECESIWCSLWTEGLAVYVSKQLNADATDASMLLTSPVPLREAVEKDRRGAICSVVAKLDSTSSEDYSPLFEGRPNPGGRFPPRYGYYVGYLVAQDLGRTRTLKQLAALKAADVRPLVEESLRKMADCPSEAGERG